MAKEKKFFKSIQGRTANQFKLELEHAQSISSCLTEEGICAPNILGTQGHQIIYEFLDLKIRIDDFWCQNNDFDYKIFKDIGLVLRLIHERSSQQLLHGDFVLHNIFLSQDNKLVVIDFHPPEIIGFDETYLYGDGGTEAVLFLLSLTNSFGLKRSVLSPSAIKSAMSYFRQGYGIPIAFKHLLQAIQRYFVLRRMLGFSRLNCLAHLIFSCLIFMLSHARFE